MIFLIVICFFVNFCANSSFFRFYFVSLRTNITTMAKKFTFREVPTGYRLCFNEHCQKHEDCIRFLAGQHVPATMMSGPAVYPNAVTDDICPFFKQTRIIHGAWGFRNLYKDVEKKDAQVLKAMIINYLGGPVACYGYMHGEKLLTPEQQDCIQGFFNELGYMQNIVFEGYSIMYDFTDDVSEVDNHEE